MTDRIAYKTNNGGGGIIPLSDINPIPLTPEILEKAGLHPLNNYFKQFGIHVQADQTVIGYFEDNEFGHEPEDEIKITSLHQLQNIVFDFTGGELEIKL